MALFQNYTKDQIAKKLLDIAESKLLVKRVVNKYRKNPHYSMIFNQQEVYSELLNTITLVINNLEKYNENKKMIEIRSKLTDTQISKLKSGQLTKAMCNSICKKLKMSNDEFNQKKDAILVAQLSETRLDTESEITGYLINAFTNNIRKMYGKHEHTGKRSFNQMIYLDSIDDVESKKKRFIESIGSTNPIKEKEFSKILVDMAKHLRKYDQRQNELNQNQKSQLTKLFCSIVNPKKCKDNEELKQKFNWSPYLLNKNKEVLIKKLREEFMDCQEEVISYLDDREQFRKADQY